VYKRASSKDALLKESRARNTSLEAVTARQKQQFGQL
jgi:hypothetical protein